MRLEERTYYLTDNGTRVRATKTFRDTMFGTIENGPLKGRGISWFTETGAVTNRFLYPQGFDVREECAL